MAQNDFFPLVGETMNALGAHYNDAMEQVRINAGMEPQDRGAVLLLSFADPEPVSASFVQQLAPYAGLAAWQARLDEAVARGFIESTPDQAYRLTAKGRDTQRRGLEAAWAAMGELAPLPDTELNRLAELLRRLVAASVNAPEPRDKSHLLASRAIDPGTDVGVVARIDQYLTDLIFFRDDVHPAAWRAYTIDGPTWETFTLIWNDQANTPETLAERHHTPDTVPTALQDLRARGWIEKSGDSYRTTETGRQVRQEAEDTTNRLFYAPWSTLTDNEQIELRDLLVRLRDELQFAQERAR